MEGRPVPLRDSILLSALAALALAGCGRTNSQAPVESRVPLPSAQHEPPLADAAPGQSAPEPAADTCGAAKVAAYLGKPASPPTLDAIRHAVGHDRVRPIRPGDIVTLDLRSDRLNVDVGDVGEIKRLYCG